MSEPGNQLEIHERLKAELRIRGTSLSKLSRELGVSAAAMTLVGQGLLRSKRIEQAIAETLATTPEALWQRENGEDEMN